eukprot:Skav204460  [mRNA]  locus=scaffold3299:7063:14085:+ [translate_table: standard]
MWREYAEAVRGCQATLFHAASLQFEGPGCPGSKPWQVRLMATGPELTKMDHRGKRMAYSDGTAGVCRGVGQPNHMAFIANGFARVRKPQLEMRGSSCAPLCAIARSDQAFRRVDHFEPRATWRPWAYARLQFRDLALFKAFSKDNTWRRSLGGNSVDPDESTRVPDNEDLEPTLPGTAPCETKSQAAKPEVFDIGTDSEDEAEGSENWRCYTKSDKRNHVAHADHDGRNGQALSTFQHPVARADSKSLIEVHSADDRAGFGKDEAVCEALLTNDRKAD